MKILFLSMDYPSPAEPGKGVFNHNLVRALAARHELRVVSPVAWLRRRGERRRWLDGVEVHHPTYYYPPGILRTWYGWFYWRSVAGTVKRLLAEARPDAVVCYWAHPDGEAAVRAARLAGARSAVIVGGSDVLLITRSAGRRRCVAAALGGADAVLAVSEHLREKVIDLGVSPDRAHLWRQGVESHVFRPGDQGQARQALGLSGEGQVLLWVGRMVPVKGLDVLLEACQRLTATGLPYRLYLVGDGPLRPSLEAEARRAGLGERVVFAGACGHDRLGDWYRAADLTVLPSRSEGLPNVLRESVACGTPFVASRVGGIAEIADPALDHLVPPEAPEQLAGAIRRALQGPRPPRAGSPPSWGEAADRLTEIVRARPALAGGSKR